MDFKLTVVMPLYGKKKYTARYLNYFLSESPVSIKLLFCDADDHFPYWTESAKNIELMRGVLMDGTVETYVQSLNKILATVKTEYVMFNDNDDFLYFPGVLDSLDIMGNDKSLNFVQGKIGHFYQTIFGDRYFLRDKAARAKKTMHQKLNGSYQYEWYSIYRAEALIKIFEELKFVGATAWTHPEVYNSLYCCAMNGVYIDRYTYFREVFVSASSDSLDARKNIDHTTFIGSVDKKLFSQDPNNGIKYDLAELLQKFINKKRDRRRMYGKIIFQIILNALGILGAIDKKLAKHNIISESDFLEASLKINKFIDLCDLGAKST